MNRSLVLASIVATTVFLGACSDASGPASSTQIPDPVDNHGNTNNPNNGSVTAPTLDGGVSVQTLQSNNGVKASPAQIEADLEAMASLENLSTTMGGFDNMDMDLPVLGSASIIGQTKRQVSLAKKTATLVAAGECVTVDTSYTSNEDGMEMSVKMQWLGADGNPIRVCEDDGFTEETIMALFSNSKISMEMSGKNDSLSMEMKYLLNINLEGSGDNTAMVINGSAMAKFDMTKPVDFNMYMEIQMSMRQEFASEEEVEPDMTITLWFQDGRYKCAADYETMDGGYNAKVCDLENAGKVVGSLWNDENGDMVVKDAEGNVVGEDAVINEEL